MARGLTVKLYRQYQMQKEESDFRHQANQRLQAMEIGMAAINGNISELFGKLRSLEVSLGIKLDSYISEQRQQRDAHISQVEKESMKLANNANQAASLYNEAVKTYVTKDQHEATIRVCAAGLNEMRKELKGFKDNILSYAHQLGAEQDRKIEAFKDEVSNRPSELPGIKKMVEEKVAIVALDGTNAIMRTQNFEKQIFIMEKRIEQLFLLIKNLELRLS